MLTLSGAPSARRPSPASPSAGRPAVACKPVNTPRRPASGAEGYHKEADVAAARILGAFLRESSFPENLASQSGLIEAAGHPHYNWGMASAYLLGTKHYRKESELSL